MPKRRSSDDFKAEIDAHLALEADALSEDGVDAGRASIGARRAVGNRTSIEERYYERRRWRFWDEMQQDVRQAARRLGRSKRFAAALVATMALGVGANTALTGAIDEILWSPLTVPRPEEVVAVHRVDRRTGRYLSTSYPDFLELRQRTSALRGLAGYVRTPRQLDIGEERLTIGSEWVTSNYFDVLEVRPILGRAFGPEDDPGGGGPPAVMMSETLWTSRFQRDPGILGQSIQLEGEALEVIAIVPASYGRAHNVGWGTPPDLWLPLGTFGRFFEEGLGDRILRTRTDDVLQLIGRLSEGASMEQAQAEIGAIVSSLLPDDRQRAAIDVEVLGVGRAKFYPGHRTAYGRQLALVGLAGVLVLLLACSNIASLLLERTSRRRQELALRASLGAGRPRLVRQLLTEALVIGIPGFVASLLVASALLQLLSGYPGALGVPLEPDLRLDRRIVTLCLLTSIAAVTTFSVVPVIVATRANLWSAATSREALTAGTIGPGLAHLLVVAQVALSTLLLAGALAMWRAVQATYQADLGFQTDRLISLSLSRSSTPRGALERVPDDVLEPERWGLPGIVAIAMASDRPLGVVRASRQVRDRAMPAAERIAADVTWVTADFFDVLQIPIVEGRSFARTDIGRAYAVINQMLARRLWDGQPAVGQYIAGAQSGAVQVVGVVADARYINLWETRPAVYLPVEATDRLAGEVLIRTSVPPAALLPDIQGRWRAMSPGLRMSSIRAGDNHVRVATESQRLAGQLVAVFSGIALLVASIGLYSAMAWMVERRQREIAIRIAVGGSPSAIASRVVLRGAAVAGAGTALGIGAAAALAPQLATLSRSSSPYDIVAFAGSVATLAAVCCVAAVIPAVRAARVDPLIVLRGE